MEIHVDSLDFNDLTIIDMNGEAHTFNIHDELKLSEYTIQQEMYSQSAKYSYWASLLERVRVYAEAEQRKLEQIGAKVNKEVRNRYEQEKKKPTKDVIESDILLDEEYQQQQYIVEQRNYQVKQLQYIVKAFEQRSSMLIQISAELRQTNKNGGVTNPFSH
nr:MAG TPA: recombination, repair and ssDNA binding protein [Herelleviridae sp.]